MGRSLNEIAAKICDGVRGKAAKPRAGSRIHAKPPERRLGLGSKESCRRVARALPSAVKQADETGGRSVRIARRRVTRVVARVDVGLRRRRELATRLISCLRSDGRLLRRYESEQRDDERCNNLEARIGFHPTPPHGVGRPGGVSEQPMPSTTKSPLCPSVSPFAVIRQGDTGRSSADRLPYCAIPALPFRRYVISMMLREILSWCCAPPAQYRLTSAKSL